ncbi:helix-turn-helix domain-containing protein [Altererythrobacter salegens]|uniref:Helix-turn-helix domain-containing protein n=1 Tax=Croceibacterium salegens TaxID=1737568 RepID=A0A6I4SR33_9SPHN|nr:helix-turn-helix domain-containing protein [Croceibacterium salegens]MXO58304.1 helix-turn-helix domain-containing protein [Croceibacterium salegens]
MSESSEVRRFTLYGEATVRQEPDWAHIEPIGTRAPLHDWTIAPHRHPDMLQLMLFEEGKCVLHADGEEFPLEPPTLVYVPCDAPHGYRFQPGAEGWVLSVSREQLELPAIAFTIEEGLSGRTRLGFLPMEPNSHHLSMLRHLFADIVRRRRHGSIVVDAGLYANLSLIFSLVEEMLAPSAHPSDDTGPRHALYRRFLTLVEERFRSGLNVAEYADLLGCSQATLNRTCRENSGEAPHELIANRRMLEARRALSLTRASVKQVANDLGFDDPAYFARAFRRHAGMTAREFRQSRMRPMPEGIDADAG